MEKPANTEILRTVLGGTPSIQCILQTYIFITVNLERQPSTETSNISTPTVTTTTSTEIFMLVLSMLCRSIENILLASVQAMGLDSLRSTHFFYSKYLINETLLYPS